MARRDNDEKRAMTASDPLGSPGIACIGFATSNLLLANAAEPGRGRGEIGADSIPLESSSIDDIKICLYV
jgi:hypothetical protein